MEKYYRKLSNGRYEEAGYSCPDMFDGLYFRQSMRNSTRTTSVNYWLGPNPIEPVDLNSLISIMKMDGDLCKYLQKLTDKDSDELEELRKDNGFIRGPLEFYNWSVQDLAVVMLRFLYNKKREMDTKKLDSPVM